MNKVCGKTKGGRVCHNETWWWNDPVNVVKEKPKKMEAVETRTKQGRISISEKSCKPRCV